MLLNGALLLAVWVGAKDTYHRNKKAFQTSYILAVLIKILFESGGWGGGLLIGCIFCLQVDGPITEGRAYLISERACNWVYFFVYRLMGL